MEVLTVVGYSREIQRLVKPKVIPQSITHAIFAFYYSPNFINYILPSDNNYLYTMDCKSLYQYILNTILSHHKRLQSTNNNTRHALQSAIHLPINIINLFCKPLDSDKIYEKSLFQPSFKFLKSVITQKICMHTMSEFRDNLIENIPKPKEVLNATEQRLEFTQDIHDLLYLLTTVDVNGMSNKIKTLITSTSTKQCNNVDISAVCRWSWLIGVISGSMPIQTEKLMFVASLKKLLNLCENCELKRSESNKIIIDSCFMYVVRKYPRFLSVHWKFLKTIIYKLFEFICENNYNEYIKDMAISSLKEIFLFRKCSRQCLIQHTDDNDNGLFWNTMLSASRCVGDVTNINESLNDEQNGKLYSALSVIITHETDPFLQYKYTTQLNQIFHRSTLNANNKQNTKKSIAIDKNKNNTIQDLEKNTNVSPKSNIVVLSRDDEQLNDELIQDTVNDALNEPYMGSINNKHRPPVIQQQYTSNNNDVYINQTQLKDMQAQIAFLSQQLQQKDKINIQLKEQLKKQQIDNNNNLLQLNQQMQAMQNQINKQQNNVNIQNKNQVANNNVFNNGRFNANITTSIAAETKKLVDLNKADLTQIDELNKQMAEITKLKEQLITNLIHRSKEYEEKKFE